ncbi:MAG: BadF/BadG/BcrA/BcrD ATPase family protein, partial [Chloroflexota bacterium]
QGKKVEDILAGVHGAIASRTIALVRRVGAESEITMTGGVARNRGMTTALEERLAQAINVSPDSHFTGAIGGAMFALERMRAAPAAVA